MRSFGAGNQIRTDDLVITNDVLYQLSHTSIRDTFFKAKPGESTGLYLGAGNQIRTDDLVITNDVPYQLSHTSVLSQITDPAARDIRAVGWSW